MRRLTDWLVYFLIRVFICVVQSLSIETCAAVSRFLAFLACDIVRIRAAIVDDNLRQVYTDMPVQERRKLVRQMWEHLFLMVCEVAHTRRKVNESNYQDYVKFHNKELLVRYLLDPRPKVLVTGHFGNFEVAGYVLGLFGFPSFTIARALDNPFLDRFISRFRSSTGQFILPKDGCSQQVDAILRAGGTLSLLGDQHAGVNGCWVDFLGRPASCHKAVALFTLTTGAPQLVCYLRRLNEPMKFEVGVVDVADPLTWNTDLAGVKPLTQWYNERLAEVIHADPEQYWWVHRRWKGEPGKRRRRKRQKKVESRAA